MCVNFALKRVSLKVTFFWSQCSRVSYGQIPHRLCGAPSVLFYGFTYDEELIAKKNSIDQIFGRCAQHPHTMDIRGVTYFEMTEAQIAAIEVHAL